ncbi:uncharacterized protein BP01DRAFT_79897 [Aspergillus saccharolyticus JOP 1030-1]|uniref:Uncharacterized protein n=1 Tax=Aspergillus saccharolyticus JOP 1030-1 TaxID=1450539 RepID=A0A318ZSB3_9EURO|nr:hypothetical protein BP01DRAFT_79897 [Aspergillus saccharolyticus JOP 1030-1]PYH49524.1 hypothetical protein BP01DRAFT_79897 [Aspergillus saccharolyticus JOP 1030-1]
MLRRPSSYSINQLVLTHFARCPLIRIHPSPSPTPNLNPPPGRNYPEPPNQEEQKLAQYSVNLRHTSHGVHSDNSTHNSESPAPISKLRVKTHLPPPTSS